GNCCADLEERVAELEATTVRKGNRVVSLEVSGHVHQAIMFWDVEAGANSESNAYVGTPNTSRSRFRFRGSASISSDLEAGFLMEIGVRSNGLTATNQNDPRVNQGLDIRHEALYLRSRTLGTVWLGQSNEATEGITEINLGGALNNSPDFLLAGPGSMLSANGNEATDFVGAAGEQAGEGNRTENVRYVSPTLAGFIFSASWGEDDAWAVALRYAGEFGAFRVAGGIGYKDITDAASGTPFNTNDGYQFGLSGSIMHTPTGLYLTGQYGENGNDVTDETDDNWYVTGGIRQNFFGVGNTNIYGKYGEYNREIGAFDAESEGYGVGIEQRIDAAVMDLYVVYNHFDGEQTNGTDTIEIDSVVLGARIQF
ncbi:MAG: hypothetical protein AAFY27_11680, partial [Pseudomonadota bacterium]